MKSVHQALNFLRLSGVAVGQKRSEELLCVSPEGEPGPAPSPPLPGAALLFPDAPPSLTSSCLDLSLGALGGQGGWMKPVSYTQGVGDPERLLCRRAPLGPASFSFLGRELEPHWNQI